MRRKILSILVVLLVSSCRMWAQGADDKLTLAYYEKYNQLIDPSTDKTVARAQKVFQRVYDVADKKTNQHTRLAVLGDYKMGTVYAAALRDGNIVMSREALDLCYVGGKLDEAGDARLAFVLGHELAHISEGHYQDALLFASLADRRGRSAGGDETLKLLVQTSDVWRQLPESKRLELAKEWDKPAEGAAGKSGESKKGEDSARAKEFEEMQERALEEARKKEMEADRIGFGYMAMADYSPSDLLAQGDAFFTSWLGQGGYQAEMDPHQSPDERASLLKGRLREMADQAELFRIGVRYYRMAEYDLAAQFFGRFIIVVFPSREALSDLGLCHYQQALKILANCAPELARRYYLPTSLDSHTIAESVRGKGSEKDCLQREDFLKEAKLAIECLSQACEKDPQYLPARVNLASAYLLMEDANSASKVIDEALKLAPGEPDVQTLEALFLLKPRLGGKPDVEGALALLSGVLKAHPNHASALYNRAAILSDKDGSEKAAEAWQAFLKAEPDGVYARAARGRLPNQEKGQAAAAAPSLPLPAPPIPLLDAAPDNLNKLKSLRASQSLHCDLGDYRLYEGDNKRILVDETQAGRSVVVLVEQRLDSPMPAEEIRKRYGSPRYVVSTPAGQSWIYGTGGFAMDVVEGHGTAMAFSVSN